MDEVYYSTGQAARELGVTQARVRALCESESIEATCTAGGQWRISRKHIEHLKRDGLPSVPRPLPNTDQRAAAPVRSRRGMGLLAEPSQTVIGSAEEVVCLENEVESLGLRRRKEEALDWFREREEREAQRLAEREEAELEHQTIAIRQRQRQVWEEKWLEYGLKSIPGDTPQSFRLDVHRAVEEVLQGLNSIPADSIICQLVVAAVDRALAPWRKSKQFAEVIREASESCSVPREMRIDRTWKARLLEAAASGLGRLREGAGNLEMETAALRAIAPVVREFEHVQACKQMVDGIWRELLSATSEEREQGKEAVEDAMSRLPIGTSRRELERARDAALQPLRSSMARRREEKMRAGVLQFIEIRLAGWPEQLRKQTIAAAHEAVNGLPAGTSEADVERVKDQVIERFRGIRDRQIRKAHLVDSGLRQIQPYLVKLALDWEFDRATFALAQELQGKIRAALEEQLRGDEAQEEVDKHVRRLVRRELDL
jgi:excisionase family DNA binding protein